MGAAKMNDSLKTYSFDVFDTCISRTYEHPTDLFFHLGYCIAPTTHNEEEKKLFALTFRKRRVTAERNANRALGKYRNCNLDAIYKLLEIPKECPYKIEDIKNLEIEMEKVCSYEIYEIKKKIEHVRSLSHRIIFISDMYLPTHIVWDLLNKHKIIESNEKLYVSSEHIETKHSGKLYRHIIKELGTTGESITHHGDNYHADVKMAIKEGLQSVHISDTAITSTEKTFKSARTNFSKSIVNSIPKFLRLNRPTSLSKPELAYFSLISPCLVSFTAWTLAQAKMLGIDTLYFVSRDAELPFKIAQKIAPYFEIEVKYLLGSRQAWLLPSIVDIDSWKGIATPINVTSSIRDALERLQFSNEEIENISEKFNMSENELTEDRSNKSLEKILESIMKDPKIEVNFNQKINCQREICARYFSECGLFSEKKWAIVDSGWSLNTQGCLKRILESSGYKKEVTGLYFGIAPEKFTKKNAGKFYSFTNNDFIYFHRAATIEHCMFPSSQNSLSHYTLDNNTVNPIFMANGQTEFDISFSNNLHKYVLDYTDKFLDLKIEPAFFYEQRVEIVENLRSFITNPETPIAKHLSNLSISIDARHSKAKRQQFFKKVSLLSFLRILFSYFTNIKKECFFWPEASAKISSPIIKHIMIFLLKFKNRKQS